MAENFVIVIDPGHGGSNEGLDYDGFLEKDMNLVTAKAMQELLQQYDNTEVYITNPDKKDTVSYTHLTLPTILRV